MLYLVVHGCLNMKTRSPFGIWLYNQLDIYDITITNLSDYSGIHTRTLYRICNGDVSLKMDDFAWIVECVSDMTSQDFNLLISSCIVQLVNKDIR